MRLILGIILGAAITVGGAYLVDHSTASAAARPMVNWDVVAKNVDELSVFARDSWKRIAG
jgi:hypothetical protein